MSSCKISVIMPVYNAEKYLEEAIESVLNQTYKNFEFIIINDGSIDKSLEIIYKYQKKDKRIVLINRKNKGLITSLNEGIEKSSGSYIARMDADDISLAKRFERQIKLMELENLDICGGHFLSINNFGEPISLNLTPIGHDLCTLSLISKVPFAHPSVMIRKSFLEKNDIKYGQSLNNKAEDFDLWIRLHEKGAKFSNVNKIIFKYRIVKNSLSKINNLKIKQETKAMTKLFCKNNKNYILEILDKKMHNLNLEEESLFVRAYYKLFLKKANFFKFKKLKKFSKKVILNTLISEFIND
jgi:glycosyltransferase involved in cell wall biosynthesis